MPLSDFTDKTWKVISSDSKECTEGKTVAISESRGALVIQCGDQVLHTNAEYKTETNRIEADGYEIKLRIVYEPKVPAPIGGSWTAEDTGGNDGDG